jgi:hypothetical protein
MTASGVYHEADGFIAGKHIAVFVKDVKIALKKIGPDHVLESAGVSIVFLGHLGRIGLDTKLIALFNAVILLHPLSVDPHPSPPDEPVDGGKRHEREVFTQEAVESYAGFVGTCVYFNHEGKKLKVESEKLKVNKNNIGTRVGFSIQMNYVLTVRMTESGYFFTLFFLLTLNF